jgi:uncharacterized protein HemX
MSANAPDPGTGWGRAGGLAAGAGALVLLVLASGCPWQRAAQQARMAAQAEADARAQAEEARQEAEQQRQRAEDAEAKARLDPEHPPVPPRAGPENVLDPGAQTRRELADLHKQVEDLQKQVEDLQKQVADLKKHPAEKK